MWIAKPIQRLTEAEKAQWREATVDLEGRGLEVPLAQTLAWGEAIRAVSGEVWLVFSPDERVGGLLFGGGGTGRPWLECVNGPLLHWWDPSAAPRQLATFAMAVSKLGGNPGGLSLRPRWRLEHAERWLKNVPVPPFARDRAATIVIPMQDSLNAQLARFSPRLRRSLAKAKRFQEELEWRAATPEALRDFVPELAEFGRRKGFTVPPYDWFAALARHAVPAAPGSAAAAGGSRGEISLWLVSAKVQSAPGRNAGAEILVCFHQNRAHYLFGLERRAGEDTPAALSPAVLAHWLAIVRSLEGGIAAYDLNGYVVDAPAAHPYAGVCRFKEQFGGDVVAYETPEFRIDF